MLYHFMCSNPNPHNHAHQTRECSYEEIMDCVNVYVAMNVTITIKWLIVNVVAMS